MPENSSNQQGSENLSESPQTAEGNAAGGSVTVQPQTEETRNQLLSGAPKGATATGQAFDHLSGAEDERIESLETRGSNKEIAGGDEIVGDYNGVEVQKPVGLQATDAFFTGNGSIDPTMVASPTGLVPVGAVAGSSEEATRRIEQHQEAVDNELKRRRGSYEALTQHQIDTMSGGDLRAVAADRGYDIPQGGTRVTRRRFARAQEEDELLGEAEEPTDE